MNFKFYLGDVIEHPTFGKGEVVEVTYRTTDIDGTNIPLVYVEFENPVRKDKSGKDVYKILFTENSLDEVLSKNK